MLEDMMRSLKSVLETRPAYHRCDEAIRGHVFCSFMALILRKELQDRLEKARRHLEWADVIRDLDRLEEIEVVAWAEEERRTTPLYRTPGAAGEGQDRKKPEGEGFVAEAGEGDKCTCPLQGLYPRTFLLLPSG